MADEKVIEEKMEATRRQMDETRASLVAKIDTLESKVAETVQGATDTVDAVKQSVAGATDAVGATVESVKESVESTVDSVKQSMSATMETVTDYLDVSAHVDHHPWLMLGGAAALGYVGGCLLNPPTQSGSVSEWARASSKEGHANGHGSHGASRPHNGRGKKHEARPQTSWLQSLASKYQPELDKFKNMAVGTLMGAIHDWLAPKIPSNFKPHFEQVMNDITSKLGETQGAEQKPGSTPQPGFASEAHRFAG